MKENIETKDVQRTEYLDKSGLDMLWAKVKENTRNQVEVERNRAVAKENSITNSLSEFVSKTTTDVQYINSTLGILGGNMISVIDYTASSDDDITMIKPQGIVVYRKRDKSKAETVEIGPTHMRFDTKNGGNLYLGNGIINCFKDKFDLAFQLDKNGITLDKGSNQEVLTSSGSTINITKYALKSELPTVLTKVSQLTNDSNFITSTDADQKYITREQAVQGFNSKQDKIVPGAVATENFELIQDIDGLKDIVRQLVRSLAASGLIVSSKPQ